jgi:hypothetical protein
MQPGFSSISARNIIVRNTYTLRILEPLPRQRGEHIKMVSLS